LPQSSHQTSASPIATISISQDLHFYVGTTQIPFEDIEGVLQYKFKEENIDEPTISLHVHRSVPMQEVVKVMNIAKDNRWKLILATTAK
jgi:biopolymer transport protein ExbD